MCLHVAWSVAVVIGDLQRPISRIIALDEMRALTGIPVITVGINISRWNDCLGRHWRGSQNTPAAALVRMCVKRHWESKGEMRSYASDASGAGMRYAQTARLSD
jgi:hypothetical protein